MRLQWSREKILRSLFDLGLAFKGVDGLLEIIGGALLWFTSPASLNTIVIALTRHELLEDPDDPLANWLRRIFSHLSVNGKLFAGGYLFAHGALKIFLVVFLLRNKLWAYPAAVAILLCFVFYQFYRMWLHFSWVLMLVSCIDSVIIFLVWHEYRYLKRRNI